MGAIVCFFAVVRAFYPPARRRKKRATSDYLNLTTHPTPPQTSFRTLSALRFSSIHANFFNTHFQLESNTLSFRYSSRLESCHYLALARACCPLPLDECHFCISHQRRPLSFISLNPSVQFFDFNSSPARQCTSRLEIVCGLRL